jgi:aminopeptidase
MKFDSMSFPPFSLSRLMKTVFEPREGERIAILIDLEDTSMMKDFGFLKNEELTVQHKAHEVFYLGLNQGVAEEMGLTGGEMYAYQRTGGSNLDLPEFAFDAEGKRHDLEDKVYTRYDIILCVSTDSATAPLTAFAKKFGFRGATLHGLNDIILNSGLSVDYNMISKQAEKFRGALSGADSFQVDFTVGATCCTLELQCGGQEAQKSHGLCRGEVPDVANLPAGEVYFVPVGGDGQFPMKYADGTLGLMEVSKGCIQKAVLLSGDAEVIEAHNAKLNHDPMTGVLGELGFGTQVLPVSGKDIQDEKILGTMHIATGRSDHLGGDLTPDKFAKAINATHDDILFSPSKTPEIEVKQVRMQRAGSSTVVLENFHTAPYLEQAMR